MPHKKGKRKTIPKHKKKGVKLIRNHKLSADYPNKTNGNGCTGLESSARGNATGVTHNSRSRGEMGLEFNVSGTAGTNKPRIAIKGKGVQNKKQEQTLQKRRLPVEVMTGNDSGPEWNRSAVCVIDNISDSLKKKESYCDVADLSDKPDIKVINLMQAKKIREQVWIHHNGKNFENKCYVSWCTNMVDVFNFQVGHDTPKALGGSNTLINLKPICQNCNQSMGSRYSIAEWNQLFTAQRRQMSAMVSRQNSNSDIIHPIEYKKIDLSSNILAMQQPLNILPELPVITIPQITQVTKMQPGNTQHVNMCYGPLARFMPLRTNRAVIIQSAFSAVVLVGAWLFGA